MNEGIMLTIITILTAIIGYFVKKTFDKVEIISDNVFDIKPKVDILWKDKIAPALLPRQLNERGENILNESGIKVLIDEKKDDLLQLIKNKNISNPYDAESSINEIMLNLLKYYPNMTDKIKNGAFSMGVDIDTVLYAGSIYLRNLIFKDLGFSIEDLDKK